MESDSMYPKYSLHEYLIVVPERKIFANGVYYFRMGFTYNVYTLTDLEDRIRVESPNPNYESYYIDKEDIDREFKIIGRVIGSMRIPYHMKVW